MAPASICKAMIPKILIFNFDFSDDFEFKLMFENSSDKLYAIAFSALGISITTPMFFSIIWYERNNHHRTLINQLVSSIIWYAIIWNATLQFPTILRYLLGPFPPGVNFINIIRVAFTYENGVCSFSVLTDCVCIFLEKGIWQKNC